MLVRQNHELKGEFWQCPVMELELEPCGFELNAMAIRTGEKAACSRFRSDLTPNGVIDKLSWLTGNETEKTATVRLFVPIVGRLRVPLAPLQIS